MTWQQQSVYHRDSWRNEMPCGSRYEHWTDEKPPPARNMYTFEPIQRPVWSQEQPRGILTPLLSLQLSPPPPSRFLPQQNPVDLNYRPCQYMVHDKWDEVAKRIQPAVPLEPKKKQLNSRNRPY
ncbi:Protein CBG27331 [Caenorhabditis briggsae]|uniref:Protein CBG27331 n=1 Tax=Caenorhabditis briggsae TaxID=6238 RepID=B6IG63_CAEBR|nr:Protein CBG27331 [Caenorhabditis briggsae]CAR98893.1 Protein CBG27331 [Caenorhabditis briggsae]